MNLSPPQPSLPTESAGTVQERPHPTEDDLLAIGGKRLQPGSSLKPFSETSSSQDISPRTQPSTSLARPPAQDAGVRIHDHPSTDDLFKPPQTTSPNPANPGPTRSSPSPPDELIHTMSQYQPVSAGSPASPRTMSQVSPGFIFVNFLSLSVCCFFFAPSLARVSFIGTFLIMSPISCLLCPELINSRTERINQQTLTVS